MTSSAAVQDPAPESSGTDSTELAIARFLRYGALFAGVLLAAGWATRAATGRDDAGLSVFSERRETDLLASLEAARQAGDVGLLVAYAGLLVLVSLPVLRVAFVAGLFLRNGERAMAAAALFVLATLGFSVWLGFVH